MELMFQDLRVLLPIFGEYEYVGGFLDVVSKFFPYKDKRVENTQMVWE